MSNFENFNSNPSDVISNQYEKSIFIWVDISGFSKIVDDDNEYIKLIDILKRFQNIFQFKSNYDTRVISDAILIEIKTSNHKGNYQKLIEIFKDIAKKQFYFVIESKYFVRGGIAVGSKLEYKIEGESVEGKGLKEVNIISNGLARSYEIETKRIDWPLIGTDKTNLKRMQKIFNTNENEMFNFSHSFNITGEDLYFLDFIDQAKLNISVYNKILSTKIDEFIDNPKIKNKYIWLLKHFKQCENCLIPDNLIGSIL